MIKYSEKYGVANLMDQFGRVQTETNWFAEVDTWPNEKEIFGESEEDVHVIQLDPIQAAEERQKFLDSLKKVTRNARGKWVIDHRYTIVICTSEKVELTDSKDFRLFNLRMVEKCYVTIKNFRDNNAALAAAREQFAELTKRGCMPFDIEIKKGRRMWLKVSNLEVIKAVEKVEYTQED